MNMLKDERIHYLIARFFEATATRAEEEELKLLLTDPSTEPTPEIEEARAVMSYSAIEKAVYSPSKKPNSTHILFKAAAAAAVMCGIITTTYFATKNPDSTCSIAAIYINGQEIKSTDAAMTVMQSQLRAMGRATEHSASTEALSALESMMTDE